MSMKRVVIVSHYYPPHHGGIETVANNQAKQLAANGYDVSVVTSSVAKDEVNGKIDGVQVLRVKAWNGLEKHGIPFPVFAPTLLTTLNRQIKQAEIVHIHDAFYMSSLCATIIARLRKKPLLLTQHVEMVPHSSKLTMIIEKIVYATSGRFIFKAVIE